jgi:hypothetical protein
MNSLFIPFALAVALTLGLAGPASATSPDWSAWAPLEEVEVITTDQEGESREHTIWIVVSEGVGYLRTSRRSTWGDNLERDGQLRLRGAPGELSLRAQLVTDAAEIERVTAAFEAKYGGFMSWFSGLIRGTPRIFRLSAPGS